MIIIEYVSQKINLIIIVEILIFSFYLLFENGKLFGRTQMLFFFFKFLHIYIYIGFKKHNFQITNKKRKLKFQLLWLN